MRVIIADSNILVALYLSDNLQIIFSEEHFEVYLTKEVFDELTSNTRRIGREYVDLAKRVRDESFREPDNLLAGVNVIDVQNALSDIEAMEIYFRLIEEGSLDQGEIESIPLAVEKRCTFVTSDEDAVTEMNALDNLGDGCCAELLRDFLRGLVEDGILTQKQFDNIVSHI